MNLPKPTWGLSSRCDGETARNSALANERKERDPACRFFQGRITTGWEALVGKFDGRQVRAGGQQTWLDSAGRSLVALAARCHAISQRLRSEQNDKHDSADLRRTGCASGPPLERQKTSPQPPQGWLGVCMLSGGTCLNSLAKLFL